MSVFIIRRQIIMSRRTKGEGTIRKRSDGRWEGRYVNCIGETKSVYGQSKTDVKRKLQEITYTNDSKVFKEIRGDIELDIWFEHYIGLKKRMIKARSLNQIKLAYNTHISPVLGDILICQISPNDIANLISILEKKDLSPVSVDNVLKHARAMFRFAAEEGVIAKSPFLYIKKDRKAKKTRRNLTNLEVEHLLEVSKSLDYPMYLMICTMLYTGIRPGELCAIRWNDFSGDFSCLKIDESLTDETFENTTKTESSERIIPLMVFLQKEYAELYQYKHPSSIENYVFINRRGRPFKTQNVDKKFRYIKECLADIYPEDNFEDITPHCLRHTFATTGLNSGVSIKSMQSLLGHANSRTLMDTYMHIGYEDKQTSIHIIENTTIGIEASQIEQSEDNKNDKLLHNKWSNVKRYKGIENYEKELLHRIV